MQIPQTAAKQALSETVGLSGRLDKLGLVIAPLAFAAWIFLPFMVFRANRIVAGEGMTIGTALPSLAATALQVMLGLAIAFVAIRLKARVRLAISIVVLLALGVIVGVSATYLTPVDDRVARVSPGGGFWLLVFAFALVATDALARLQLRPWVRIGLVAATFAVLAVFLSSGLWNDLSVMKEYANRAGSFWREAQRHLFLAFGSLAVATAFGIPLGILLHQVARLRGPVLGTLNILQTVPSIALFGLLIAPLSYLAASFPALRSLGIGGIGAAPAFIALFAYSLLPVVANTVVGLGGVPASVTNAAAGMGMTRMQRLVSINLPLAFPVILTGIRIVLVQNIGLATIAALIGGGGFGVFVFQGVGQTAMDLVLLGALPTVVLAFASAVILDALVDMAQPAGQMRKMTE
jgi:osmoprotectant transport system permease protein